MPSHLARRLHQICLGATAEVLEPAGLIPGEFGLLAAVQDLPDLEQRGLARALGIDAVSAGHMIDRLEAAGLLQRRVDPGDRRARLLSATSEGAALRERLRPAALEAQERIMAALTPEERHTFLDLLTRIVETNKSYARPGNGRRHPRRSRAPDKE